MKEKIKRSDAIRAELAQTDERIAEFRPQLDERKEAVAKTNSDFLKGEMPIADAIAARTAYELIEEALNTLIESRDRLAAELESALTVEANEETIGAMRVLAIKRRKAYDQYVQQRQALNDTAADMLEAKTEFDQAQSEFIQNFKKLVPGFSTDLRWPNQPKHSKVDFGAVLAALDQAGVPRADVDFVMLPPTFPRVECEAVVIAAENYQIWAESQKRLQNRLENIDRLNHQQTLAREAEAERFEKEQRIKAEKQKGTAWRFAS